MRPTITTAGFSVGAKEATLQAGAAPLTLIEVEKLVRHELGIRKPCIEVWELDESPVTLDEPGMRGKRRGAE